MITRQSLRTLMILLLLALASTPAHAAWTAGQSAVSGPVTAGATWMWSADASIESVDLVGLAPAADPAEPLFLLRWSKDDAGWFATWRLRLRTPSGVVDLMSGLPGPGKQYRASLSYNPSTAILSGALYDDASGVPLIAKGIETDQFVGPMVAVASASTDGRDPQLMMLGTDRGYRPLDTRLEVGVQSAGGAFLPMASFDRAGDALVRVMSDVRAPGKYRLSLLAEHPDAERVPLGAISLGTAAQPLAIALDRLPPGPATLRLEYIEEGQVHYTATQRITIGKLGLSFALARIDRERGVIHERLTLDAPTPLPGVELNVSAGFTRLIWDAQAHAYRDAEAGAPELVLSESVDRLRDESGLTFDVPMPARVGAWRLELAASATPKVATMVSGAREVLIRRPGLIDYPIATTDQASQQILVFDPHVADWNQPEAITWSWSPSADNGFAAYTPGWGKPSGVKLRHCATGECMLVVDSEGLAAIVSYPSGQRIWSRTISGNLHAAELLPDGNIAIAASTGGWVRVYTASQGAHAHTYAEFALPGAHGVLWDPERQILWALGRDELVALNIQGSAAQPVIKKVEESRLPTRGGHELSPVYTDPDRLWVSTGAGVYQYVKSTGTWLDTYLGADLINKPGTKSIGNQPSGRRVITHPKAGTLYSWTTDTVELGVPSGSRTRRGAAFYKARIWNPDYQ